MERFHVLKITEIDHTTPNAVLIRFGIPAALSESFSFHPGQYVSLETNINKENIRRSYSICSTPEEPLQVGIKKVPQGVFSTYAKEKIKVGDQLNVAVPEGRFIYKKNTSPEKLTGFAAGSGITPIMSILKSVLAAHPENKFHLVYGNKTIEETMFYATLKTLEKDYNGRLSITWVFSQANEEGAFFGRIDQAIVKNYLNKETEDVGAYYLCGPKTMIETTTAVLQEKGVAPKAILSELFVTTPTSEISGGEENQLTIVCDGVEHSLHNKEGRTILDAALQEKIDVPYSCQGGVCCSCIARIESGSAKMESNQILSDDEVEEGLILTCQALVTSPSIRVNYDDV